MHAVSLSTNQKARYKMSVGRITESMNWSAICPLRPEKLFLTTPSLAVETMGARIGVEKQSFFGLPGQYGRLVTRANGLG